MPVVKPVARGKDSHNTLADMSFQYCLKFVSTLYSQFQIRTNLHILIQIKVEHMQIKIFQKFLKYVYECREVQIQCMINLFMIILMYRTNRRPHPSVGLGVRVRNIRLLTHHTIVVVNRRYIWTICPHWCGKVHLILCYTKQYSRMRRYGVPSKIFQNTSEFGGLDYSGCSEISTNIFSRT
jgi:hypothetical protein